MRRVLVLTVAIVSATLVVAGGIAAPERGGVIPKPGVWVGKTWQDRRVNLEISSDGRYWRNFRTSMVLYCEGTRKRNFKQTVWFARDAWQPIKIQSGTSVSYMSRDVVKAKTQQGYQLDMWVRGTFHYTAGSGSSVSTYVRGLLNVFIRHPAWGLCYLYHASDMSGWEARPSG